MPLFKFQCRQCRRVSELLLPRHDAPANCPECGSGDMQKLPSHFAASAALGCANEPHCPAAGTHACGCGCGCGGHKH